MANFVVIEKDSLSKSTVDTNHITLSEASIIHTKMNRDDVAEYIRDGDHLLLKLKNGEVIVIENFFVVHQEVTSDLVFEDEDGCILYWFDGVSGFKEITGLEALLPEASSHLTGMLPWLIGTGVVGGVIAATHDNDKNKENIPNGKNSVEVKTDGSIIGKTENIPEGTKVVITITGQDKNGNTLSKDIEVTVQPDGSYTAEVPEEFVDGDLTVSSEVVDRNGNTVQAEDQLGKNATDDPNTPEDESAGLDRVDSNIDIHIDNTGKITGTTKDVAPNSDVVITITGKDAAGKDVVIHKTVKTDADGNYQTELTVADGIVDGSAVNVEATTTDRNGQGVGPASDHLAGQGDNDNDPSTPDHTGLDLVTAEITVEINTAGKITGTTKDVAPNSDVVISITGKDAAGKDVVIHKTVKTDADGNYQTELTVADGIVDGSAVNVEATTTDRNGQGVGPASDHLAGQGDNDNDPSTPDDTGLDLVTAEITVEINTAGKITGTTKDVAPNSDVVISITGKDAAGKDVVIHKTVKTDADGNYQTELTVADGIVDGSAVNVEATTTDRNGQGVGPASDHLAGQGDNDNDPSTPDDTGLDLVTAEITVEINTAGKINGTTTDVAPNSDVVISITGKDAAGKDVVIHKTVKTDADGNYQTELTVADGIVDGSSVTVEATTTDRNGQGVGPASDHLAGQGDNDNDPNTPDDTGLDLVTAEITVEINTAGKITGTTTDVAPNSDVVISITGKDAAGKDVVIHKTVKTDADGNYQTELTVADGIVDGSAVNVEATTTDRNGQGVGPASDHLAGQGDNDNDPSTPDDTGLDLVTAEITVEINTAGKITGTTKDVAPNSDVVISITGKDAAGKDVVIHKTVKTDADGNYQTELTVADGIVDGSAVNVEATTTDRNGQGVGPATDHLAGQGDNDNDPSTPDDTGLDLVTAEITVEINTAGKINGTTTDVAPNSDVVISITGKDAAGKDVVIHKTVKTDADGNYQTELTVADGIVDGSSVTVEATTTDRNGQGVGPATDHLAGQGDNDNDPSTPDDTGLDLVTAEITVEINTAGKINGTTTDVAPNSDVVISITGKDAAGKDVVIHKTVKTDADGNYQTELTVADGIVDGSSVTVEATTTDRNGQGVGPASDHLAGQGDNDNDPNTPDDTGLDLVTAEITVEINTAGKITGTTTDVAPNSDVVISITGKDAAGKDVVIHKTVKTDADGNYQTELTVADGIVDGSAVNVEATTTDRNGQGVGPASDHLAGQGDNDNDPSTPDDTGLDLVTAEITVEINTAGKITGTTKDVAPNSDVVISITGKDAAGKDVVIHKTVKTDADGNYQTELTVADGIVDGSAVNVEATTTDRNGQGVGPATDHLAGQGDNDNDPSTPDDTGLDLVTAEITVEINTAGKITGTTTDVAPNSDVVISITGKDAAGKDVVIHKTVKTDADGNYQTELTVADGIVDGSAVNVEATTTDRNGQGVGPATDHLAGQGDNDNDPSTPDDTGLDLVTAEITVEINTAGKITGTTKDVAPNSDVVISITGKDAAGKDVVIHKTVKTDADGNYQTELTVADGIVDGSAVNVEATTTDRNGQGVGPASDHLAGQGDNDNDPSTPDDTGLDLVTAEITVEINTAGKITGTTKDVAPNSDVVISITGKDAAGKDVVIHKTVKTDADGNYQTELTVADGIVDGSSVTVEATTTDRNGQGVGPASDHLAGQGDNDNDPTTPDDTGLDLVTAEITVEINTAGKITGTTKDVAPNSDVVITITGKDAAGKDVVIHKTVKTDADGNYQTELTVADGIVDGSAVNVEATTTDRNGQGVGPASDHLAGQGDNDNDPSTPDDTGLDLVTAEITVEINTAGKITGTTTDVAPNSDVVITITGKDAAGKDVVIHKTVKTDADGNYQTELTVADGIVDGSSVTVEATTTDRNGQGVGPATDHLAGQGDNDNDPSTPDDTGLDLVTAEITVEINTAGKITGTTTDVAPNSDVVITITGKDAAGKDVVIHKTVKTDADGNYQTELTVADGIVDGSAVNVEATTTDRNGQGVGPATDHLAGQGDNDNDPSTPDDTGLDLVTAEITVEINTAGKITGTTKDVAPNSDVVITITGKDVVIHKTVKTDADGNYQTELTVADGIVDGSSVTVEATTTDRNGQGVGPASDHLAGQGDNDNDPNTPDDTGLDLVTAEITVEINTAGKITGTTTDVAPNSDVVISITGKDAAGKDVVIHKTVKTDADGNYQTELTVADGIVDGSAVNVEATTTDRNGQGVGPASDHLAGQGDNDNDPSTPDDTGLDLVTAEITVEINTAGKITGTTKDVAPNSDVVISITGKDAAGKDVVIHKTVKTDADGNYQTELTVADGIVDGSAVNVEATTTDRNGQGVGPATDHLAGQGDNDNDPSTPDDTGLDLVTAEITVEINTAGKITGTTTDVAPNSDVVISITGKDAAGKDVVIHKTVKTDADGNYQTELTVADGIVDGSAVNVEATTTDRNGQGVGPATDHLAGQGDNDNDPSTPDDTGLDLVTAEITVEINTAGKITGTTTDVAPNSNVVITIKGYDENGEQVEVDRTVQTDSNGHYVYELTPADGIATGTQGSTVDVVAKTNDRNGNTIQDHDVETVDPVIKNDQSTGVTNGDNSIIGTSGDDLIAGDTGGLKTNFVAGNNYNVSIVLDLSGSMLFNMAGTIRNGANVPEGETRLEIAKKGLKAFIQQMVDHDGTINLQIASFSANNSLGNTVNKIYTNVSVDNIDQIFADIGTGKNDGLQAGGGTYPEIGFNKAVNWFNDVSDANFENQTYYITDGEPNSSQNTLDSAFRPLADQSKVFAVGVSSAVSDATVSRYDNTDANGNKLPGAWSGSNHGEAKAIADADKLIAYLIGGSENFVPADVGSDTIKGGAGDDILFGDAMNTNWITWSGRDPLMHPQYSGYSTLIAYLKAEVTSGVEPTQQQIYDFVKENYKKFVEADANDPVTKGGNDTIYGGAGDDIIIAGAGNDIIYGGSGNDIISTGRGNDTIMYDVLVNADATGGNGTDVWVDYQSNDKIEFSSDFFDGLLSDKSNIGEFIKIEDDGRGNAVLKVDRDGSLNTQHEWADILIIEGKSKIDLMDMINQQIVIG